MRSLIIGGTSFVGGRLLERLQGADHEVTLLNRGKSGVVPDGVGLLVADRRDPETMRQALGNTEWDRVFDVSGFVMTTGAAEFDDLLDTLDGRVGRYVFVSSIMAYEPTGYFPWSESQPLLEGAVSTYGGFKAHAERALLARHQLRGFPAAIGRPAAIYGRENNIYDMEAAMFHRLRRGLPVLVPHGGLVVNSYGHVDDLCEALYGLGEHPDAIGEAFNISGEGVTSEQYVRTLAEIVGVDVGLVMVPDERLATLTKQPFGHLFAAKHHALLNCAKVQERLDLPAPRDFRTGHTQTYQWFCDSQLTAIGTSAADPLWGGGFDFTYETGVADAIKAAP